MFQAALAAQGEAAARVVPWLALAGGDLSALPDEGLLRIDAAGEDAAVERALLRRGWDALRDPAGVERCGRLDPDAIAALPVERGRILAPRQAHLGFLAVLADLDVALRARPGLRALQPPAAIAELFDKRATWRRWRALGVPVPETIADVREPDELRAAIDERGWRSVFVKLSSGSSASCLAMLVRLPGGREHLMTTIEHAGDAAYNSLWVRRVEGRAAIDRVLAFLLAEGSQIERAVPKARLGGRVFDCRVLVIDGEPAFVVVRTAAHPITNLHLGGRRGDLDALRAAAPPGAFEAALDTCRRVHAAALGAFHVGVDVLFEPGLRVHRVIEANAFGDLLPNLTRDGLDVYQWQIQSASGRRGTSPRPT